MTFIPNSLIYTKIHELGVGDAKYRMGLTPRRAARRKLEKDPNGGLLSFQDAEFMWRRYFLCHRADPDSMGNDYVRLSRVTRSDKLNLEGVGQKQGLIVETLC